MEGITESSADCVSPLHSYEYAVFIPNPPEIVRAAGPCTILKTCDALLMFCKYFLSCTVHWKGLNPSIWTALSMSNVRHICLCIRQVMRLCFTVIHSISHTIFCPVQSLSITFNSDHVYISLLSYWSHLNEDWTPCFFLQVRDKESTTGKTIFIYAPSTFYNHQL